MPASINHRNIITNNNANICFLIIIHVSFYMENITVGWKVFRKIGGCTGNDSHDSHVSTSHAVEIALRKAAILKFSTSGQVSWSYLVSACRAWAAFLRFSCFLSWKRLFYEVLQAAGKKCSFPPLLLVPDLCSRSMSSSVTSSLSTCGFLFREILSKTFLCVLQFLTCGMRNCSVTISAGRCFSTSSVSYMEGHFRRTWEGYLIRGCS